MKQAKVDPIKILRESFTQNKLPEQSKQYLIFDGGLKLPLLTKTAWESKDKKKQYQLGDLWYFLNCKDQKKENTYYYQTINEQRVKLQLISYPDQKEVEDYFFGKKEFTECINQNLIKVITPETKGIKKETLIDFSHLIENSKTLDQKLEISDDQEKMLKLSKKWEKADSYYKNRVNVKKDFTFCIEIMENRYKRFSQSRNARAQKYVIGSPNSVISKILNRSGSKRQRPIIIVPDEILYGNLNLQNAKHFMNRGDFTPMDEHEKLTRKSFEIYLNILNKKIAFEVYDDFYFLKNKRKIENVVAIFIKGSPYQFKDVSRVFKCKNIAALFNRVRGYHLKYHHQQVNKEVQQWNVKILDLQKHSPHKDKLVQEDFLEDLEQFLIKTLD